MAADIENPMVSYILLSYNHEDFIEDALIAALSQDYAKMEIIVSDDASTDATYERIKALTDSYRGPAKVIARRNTETMGVAGHINLVASIASGKLIVAAAGDDVPTPDRVSSIVEAFADESVYAVHSNANIVDPDGKVLADLFPKEILSLDIGAWREIARRGFTRISGSTMAVRREVYETFGPMTDFLPAEDQVLAFRAALLGKVVYIDRPLVSYRLHGNNLSHWGRALSAESISDIIAVKWRQSHKSLAEKKTMLADLRTLWKMGRLSSDDYQQAKSSLEGFVTIDELRCVFLNRNRPWLGSRLFLALKAAPQIRPWKKCLRLLCVSLSPHLFYWLKRKLLRPSVENRLGMDSHSG